MVWVIENPQGGDVNIFLKLIKSKEWKTFYLTTNYRSKQEILKKAELVIRQVEEGELIDKRVKAFSTEKGEVMVASKFRLKQFVLDIPKEEYRDYFLLVRTNKQLYEVMQLLDAETIPYSCFKKGSISLSEMREELNRQSIKLLTVHTSKGLESKKVILYGNFPIKQPGYISSNDERKVMYVGMTRAMDKLIILN